MTSSPVHVVAGSRPIGILGRMFLASALLVACSGDPVSTGIALEPQFGPGGGGPPIKVTATDPDTGDQGTTLVVRVFGSNFENGSTAEFRLNGVATGKVRTNSTTFVSADELEANVTIDGDADLGLYDVEVITPHGKKGVGTELFTVQMPGGGQGTGILPLDVTVNDGAGQMITSDGAGIYVDGTEGVEATVERQFVFGPYGAPAPPVERMICFDFGSEADLWFPGQPVPLCAPALWNTSRHDNDPGGVKELPVGDEMRAFSRFIFRDPSDNRQVWVQFGDANEEVPYVSPDRIVVRRLDDDTWQIEATTQLARILKEGPKVRGKATRDTLGFVNMPWAATLRRK